MHEFWKKLTKKNNKLLCDVEKINDVNNDNII